MNPRFAISLTVLASLVCNTLSVLAQSDSRSTRQRVSPDDRPNIVFLLADDLGWTGLRCFGSDFYETLNLDQLAKNGMKFTDAYSACTVCSPTRASIMTGMYPARLKLTDFIPGQNRPTAKMLIPKWTKRLELNRVTVAERLKQAGYSTLHVGKWHLSPAKNAKIQGDFGPIGHGFDVSITKPAGSRGYVISPQAQKRNKTESTYVTDYLTDKAVDLIDEHKAKPFFLYFAYHTPHTPIQGRPDLVAKYKNLVKSDATHRNPVYAAMVNSLDQSVGRILEQLKKNGLERRTIIIFTSDNGGLTQRYGKHDGFTENLPLRRGKGSAYEGGVRVPTIVHWPGVTKPGSVCGEPVSTIDYLPTITELARADSKTQKKEIDGRSLVSLFKNSNATLNRDLFWHYPHYHAGGDGPYSAVRSGRWRLIEFHEDKHVELYDLAADIGEQSDLSKKLPDRAKELHSKLNAWRKSVGAQMPKPNPNAATSMPE
jgi:arylsulfatase A